MDKKDADRANDGTAEKLTEAVRGSYEALMEGAATVHESNARLARSFFESSIEALEAQAEIRSYTLQSLAGLAREQREAFRELSRQSLSAYDGFLDSLSSYYREVLGEPEEEPDG